MRPPKKDPRSGLLGKSGEVSSGLNCSCSFRECPLLLLPFAWPGRSGRSMIRRGAGWGVWGASCGQRRVRGVLAAQRAGRRQFQANTNRLNRQGGGRRRSASGCGFQHQFYSSTILRAHPCVSLCLDSYPKPARRQLFQPSLQGPKPAAAAACYCHCCYSASGSSSLSSSPPTPKIGFETASLVASPAPIPPAPPGAFALLAKNALKIETSM